MDWSDPNLMAMFGLEPTAAADQVDDDADKFYDDSTKINSDAQAGAAFGTTANNTEQEQKKVQNTTTPQGLTDAAKAENQRRAELLRAKLLAKRQNTPSKAPSRAGTPAKVTRTPKVPVQKEANANTNDKAEPVNNNHVAGLEALLSEGKKMADEKTAALAAAATKPAHQPQSNGESNQMEGVVKAEETVTTAPQPEQTKQQPEQQLRPTELNDSYYADLPAWLELTGYHDVEFRNSKLQNYKARRALEVEMARISHQMEILAKEQEKEPFKFKGSTPKPTTNMAPPPLPQSMPVEKASPQVNGTKRARSPERLPPEKMRRREENGGFRIRGGANDSPDARPGSARRPQTPSPTDLERRISYPDARRRSIDDHKAPRSRDHSLERRQAYYRNDGDRGDFNNNRYDQYIPRDGPRDAPPPHNRNNGRGRTNGYHAPGPQYRGSATLDLRKGGVRYFMIKSWNHDNVAAAQRDDLWATQEKNEELLTEAFATSRHVILFFSVNKSMHFAGYALMTSPPTPSLRKPSWTSKLKWGTSEAFTLHWLSTTPVHFKIVGHIKNEMNLDEEGMPRAVLVGYDGQEICAEAGRGVVEVMDEAEGRERLGS